MAVVELSLPQPTISYSVRIEPGLLPSLGRLAGQVAPADKAGLVVDEGVETTHGRAAAGALDEAGFDTHIAVLSPSEKRKSPGTVFSLHRALVKARLERDSPVVVVGGGIIGDTAGYAAATYLRGVPLIQCPTTLLAMVDASVGGKTGVNTREGKNLIGAFYQPRLVAIDVETLWTLPARELRCGLAECIKHALIRDPQRFDWLEQHMDQVLDLDPATLSELVEWNVRIKAAVVQEDEREAGVRAHLNFGHTFAHAIEATTRYGRIHHGEAVALGMVAATALASDLHLADQTLLRRLIDLLTKVGLPTHDKRLPSTTLLINAMGADKKVKAGRIRLILPDRLGQVRVHDDIDHQAIANAWEVLRGRP